MEHEKYVVKELFLIFECYWKSKCFTADSLKFWKSDEIYRQELKEGDAVQGEKADYEEVTSDKKYYFLWSFGAQWWLDLVVGQQSCNGFPGGSDNKESAE